MSGRLISANTSRTGTGVRRGWSSGSGTASSCGASRRRPAASCRSARRRVGEQDVGELERRDRRARQMLDRRSRLASPRLGGRRPSCRCRCARRRLVPSSLLQLLDLLQDQLELVLGAVELAREPRDVRAGRRAAGCAARGRRRRSRSLLSATTFSVIRARAARRSVGLPTSCSIGLRGPRLRLLVQAADLLLRGRYGFTRGGFSHDWSLSDRGRVGTRTVYVTVRWSS